MTFTALLDTCVLWPSLQRDLLLSMAAEGLFRPIWSHAILDELAWAERLKRVERGAEPDKASEAAERLVAQMSVAFDDSCVMGWEPLVGSYGLPDFDDEHLVAAAVVGGAGVIVSHNVKDLPQDKLPGGLLVVEPDRFAADTVSVAPRLALAALRKIAARYEHPMRTPAELLSIISERYGMSEAAAMMRSVLTEEGDG